MKPSIEIAARMADILDVSLDYLVSKTDLELDSKTLNRVLEVQKLPADIKENLFILLICLSGITRPSRPIVIKQESQAMPGFRLLICIVPYWQRRFFCFCQ